MSFLDFPDHEIIRFIDTSEAFDIGEVNPVISGIVKHVRMIVYIKGTQSITNEALYVTITDINGSHESSPTFLTDIDFDDMLDDWIGYLRFDFQGKGVENGRNLTVSVRPENYTKTDTLMVGLAYPFLDNTPQIDLSFDRSICRDIYVNS